MTIGMQTDVRLPVVFQPDRPGVHFLKTGEWKLPPHNGIPNISEFGGSSVEPDHSTSSLTAVPCITSLFTAPPIERRPLPNSLRKYLSPNLTTSGPSAADTTTSGPGAANVTAFGPSAACDIVSGSNATNVVSGSSAVQDTASGPSAVHLTTSGPRAAYSTPLGTSAEYLTTSGPCATHFTTPGPRAAQPTSPGPSADLTTTSTDLDDRARFPPSSPTSHHRRTPTSPTPSYSEINPSAFLAQLYPSVSGCDHDVAQSDEGCLSLAPKMLQTTVALFSGLSMVNLRGNAIANSREPRRTSGRLRKLVVEESKCPRRIKGQHTMPFKRVWPRIMANHIKFAVLFFQRKSNRRHSSRSTRLILCQLDSPLFRISSWFYVTDIT